MKVSNIDRRAGFTDSDAKDSVGDRPGRYSGRSRARPSFYSSNPQSFIACRSRITYILLGLKICTHTNPTSFGALQMVELG